MAGMFPGPRGARSSSNNDIYAVLLFIAVVFLLFATIYVGYRAQTMFGGLLPPGGA
jgi:hypothetical protein